MLDSITRKRIDDCRDILVGKLPDPKAQIEQITIALIYKFMNDMDKEAVELGAQAKFFSGNYEKYSWDNLFDTKVTANEMLTLYSDAIASMDKNPNIPQLFRDIFKNAFLPYRDPETLKLFLKTIGEFEYTHSEELGNAFEYLLLVMGSQGDAGQFRTPRHIIDFIVAVVNPQKNDTILDPACGTAGFLISAFRYIMGNGEGEGFGNSNAMHSASADNAKTTENSASLNPEEQKRIISNFTGYDISPDMVRLSLVNLYLHGFSDPHIWEYDTLSSEDRWNETADVILANPPFMSPKGGIRPHKKFSINSNRSEVLFVDYIAEHLNPKGRAGIIVPEGVIFQSGTAYKELRKMLVDNYLYAVVSLPAGVFNPYSGVKTSILLMDKELAKTCDELLFVKIDNDGYSLGAQRNPVKGGQLDEAIAIIRSFVSTMKKDKTGKKNITDNANKTGNFDKTGNDNKTGNANKSHIFDKKDNAMVAAKTQSIASLPTSQKPGDNATKNFLQNQTIAHVVSKSEIAKNGDYNLSGERYKTQIISNTSYPLIQIEELFESIRNGRNVEQIDEVGKYKVTRIQTIADKTVDLEKTKWTNDDIPEEYFMEEGDILLSHINSFEHLAKSAIFKGISEKVVHGPNLIRFKPDKNKIIPEYAAAIFKSEVFIEKAKTYAQKAVNQASLRVVDLKSIQIPLPPLSVQEEIVAEIEGYQKIIDGAKMVVDNYKPQIDIDPEWEMVELGEIVNNFQYGSSKKSLDSGSIPCLRMGNIQNGEIEWHDLKYAPDDEEFDKYLLQENDVLFNRTNSAIHVGKTGIFRGGRQAVFAGYLIRIQYKREKILGQYLNYCLNTKEAKDFCQRVKTDGINQSNINAKILATFSISLPSIKTQEQIVSRIEKEQELVNANKQLIELFEQKIKDRIAKVWGE